MPTFLDLMNFPSIFVNAFVKGENKDLKMDFLCCATKLYSAESGKPTQSYQSSPYGEEHQFL